MKKQTMPSSTLSSRKLQHLCVARSGTSSGEFHLKPLQCGRRFAGFKNVSTLPDINSSPTTGQRYNTQRVYQHICEWFAKWLPWQQKLLVCGITNRCSTAQLEALVTILEPVFHRNFATSLRNSFPASLLRRTLPSRPQPFTQSAKERIRERHDARKAEQARFLEAEALRLQEDMGELSAINSFADDMAEGIVTEVLALNDLAQSFTDVFSSHAGKNANDGAEEKMVYMADVLGNLVKDACSNGSIVKDIATVHSTPRGQVKYLTNALGNLISESGGTLCDADQQMMRRFSCDFSSYSGCLSDFATKIAKQIIGEVIQEEMLEGQHHDMVAALGNLRLVTDCPQRVSDDVSNCDRYNRKLSSYAWNFASDILERVKQLVNGVDHLNEKSQDASAVDSAIRGADCDRKNFISDEQCYLSDTTRDMDDSKSESLQLSMGSADWMSEISDADKSRYCYQPPRTYTISALDHCVPRTNLQQSQHYNSWSSYPAAMLTPQRTTADLRSHLLTPLHRHHTVKSGDALDVTSCTGFGKKHVLSEVSVKSRMRSLPDMNKSCLRRVNKACRQRTEAQLNDIWKWLEAWQDHEKLTLLSEIMKLCNPELINYLAQCLFRRLQERININWLSDRLLLCIFSYLPDDAIVMSSQVCRRWHYLCSMDEFWMVKCHEMGARKGIDDLTDIVVQSTDTHHIDWRRAYEELLLFTDEAKKSMKQPITFSLDLRTKSEMRQQLDQPTGYQPPQKGDAAQLVKASELLKRGKKSYHEDDDEEMEHEEAKLDGSVIPDSSRVKLPTTSKASTVPSVISGKLPSHVSDRLLIRRARHPVISEQDELSSRAETIMDHTENRMQTSELTQWIRGKGKTKDDEEEVALDVRTNLQQIPDLLGKCSSAYRLHWKCDEEDGKMKGKQKGRLAGLVQCVKKVKKFDGHMDAVLCIEFDKRRLFTGGLDRTIRVWDIRSGRSIHKLCGHKGGVTCMKNDLTDLYSGSWDMAIMVWDLIHFRRKMVILGHENTISCMQMSKEHLFSGSHDTTVRVWSRASLQSVHVFSGHTSHVNCMVYNSNHLTTGSSDRTIRITNVTTGECKRIFSGFSSPIHRVIIEGGLVIAANQNGQLFFCCCDSGEIEAAIQAHQQAINAIAFHDGRFYTASSDMKIKEWDLLGMTCVRSLLGHRGHIYDMKLSRQRLVSCSSDGDVRIWDFHTPYVPGPQGKPPSDLILPMVVSQSDIS